VKSWVRIALIVALALVLWYLVIDLTESMTGSGTPQAPATPTTEVPAPAAPGQLP
jgi:hypothetical protein